MFTTCVIIFRPLHFRWRLPLCCRTSVDALDVFASLHLLDIRKWPESITAISSGKLRSLYDGRKRSHEFFITLHSVCPLKIFNFMQKKRRIHWRFDKDAKKIWTYSSFILRVHFCAQPISRNLDTFALEEKKTYLNELFTEPPSNGAINFFCRSSISLWLGIVHTSMMQTKPSSR